MPGPRRSFRAKLFLTLGALVCIAIAMVVAVAETLVQQQFRSDFTERFDRTVVSFHRLQQQRAQFVADEVVSLSRGNPQFRTILSTASVTSDPLGLGGGTSRDEVLRDANLRLRSLLPGLVLHEKSEVFVLVDAEGRLLYSKAAPDSYGDDLSGLGLLPEVAEDGMAITVWRDPVPGSGRAPLLPTAGGPALYEIVAEAVVFGDEWHGTLIAGSEMGRDTLEAIRTGSGVELGIYSQGRFVAGTLHPQLLSQAAAHIAATDWFARERRASSEEWKLGTRRFLVRPSPVAEGEAWSDAAFVLLQPLDAEVAFLQRLRAILFGIGLAALVLAVVAAYRLAGGITRPVAVLHEAVRQVGTGDLQVKVDIRSNDEFRDLGDAFNDAVRGLRERDVLRRTFDRYVSKGVAEELLRNPGVAQIAGVRREVTVFFVDIEGFTSLSETLSPESVVARLDEYLELVCAAILDFDGTVNQFQGDGVVAFWSAPVPQADHAQRACRAALRCREGFVGLQRRWMEKGLPRLGFRIGIHTGEAIVGEIGSAERSTYTVIGDTANLASRLEGVNKVFGTTVICSEQTVAALGPDLVTRELDCIRVAGRRAPLRVYELVGETGALDEQAERNLERYAEALAAWRRRSWDDAEALLSTLLANDPDDGPSRSLLERVRENRRSPPRDDWDGVLELSTK